MLYTFDWLFILKGALIAGLVQALSTPLYSVLFGFPKRALIRHSNIYFRFIASGLNYLAVMVPLLNGVNASLVFLIAITANLLLQKIADDYIS